MTAAGRGGQGTRLFDKIILADEPTGALDSKSAGELMDLFHKLNELKTIVIVTHDPEIAR